MRLRSWLLVSAVAAVFATAADAQQYPIMEKVADKVVQKYQTSSCEQLAAERASAKNKPKPPAEQKVVEALRNDPQMRQAFFNRIAPTVVNKLFECGMIP